MNYSYTQSILLPTLIGRCEILITSEPQDATVSIGDTAYFNCSYMGTTDVPFWVINSIPYPIDRLPGRHEYRNQVLSVGDVRLTDSGRTYQCSFFEPRSMVATLTVLNPEGKDTSYSGKMPLQKVKTSYSGKMPLQKVKILAIVVRCHYNINPNSNTCEILGLVKLMHTKISMIAIPVRIIEALIGLARVLDCII